MAQINLLSGQAAKHTLPWVQLLSIISKILIVLILICLGVWGYLYFVTKKTTTDIYKTQNLIKGSAENLIGLPERKEVITRQGQLKAFNGLVANQTHWSVFFATKLAPITLKTSRFVTINAQNDGHLRLSVSVPSYADLDKFLQVFDSFELNKVFSDIKVTSLAKSQNGDKLDIRFDVTMKYKPEAARASE